MTNTNPIPPSVSQLLDHRAWVRSVARALLRSDPAAAADLEQDVWARVMADPPADVARPRAWLATVVRNRFRDLRKGDDRREQRERAVGEPRARRSEESPEVLAARAEEHRRVVQAVLALSPTYRDVVLLRWFEGLEPAEVARRLDLPASTVRTRLQRAHAQLREALVESHGGDERRSRRGLLLLLGPAAPVEALRARPRRWGWAIAGVAVVAMSVGVWWASHSAGNSSADVAVAEGTDAADSDDRERTPRRPRGGDRSPTDSSSTAEPADWPDDAEVGGMSPLPDDAETDAEVVSGARETGVRARVLDGDVAVEGAAVRLVWSYRDTWESIGEAVTDDEGRAVLDWGPTGPAFARLVAEHEGRVAISRLVPIWSPEREEVLHLESPRVLRGVLHTGELHTPLSNGVVRMFFAMDEGRADSLPIRTDARGEFELPPLPASSLTNLTLELSAEGFVTAWRRIGGRDLAQDRVRLELHPDYAVSGRCVDAEGRPISDVRVSSVYTAERARTDLQGRFELRGLDRLEAPIEFSHDDFAKGRRDVAAAEGRTVDLGDVLLATGRAVSIRVVDDQGNGLPNAHVVIVSEAVGTTVWNGHTRPDGTLTAHHLADEPHRVTARTHAADRERYTGWLAAERVVEWADETVVLVPGPQRTVFVRFVDAEGAQRVVTRCGVHLESLTSEDAARVSFGSSEMSSVRVLAPRSGLYRVRITTDGGDERVFEEVPVHDDRETVIDVGP